MKEKTCTVCGVMKPYSEFNVGRSYIGGVRSMCRECQCKDHKEYYEKNADKIKSRTKRYAEEHPREYWAYSTTCSHKKRGYVVVINRKELIDMAYDTDFCEICECKLDWGMIGKYGSPISNSPTLDRMNQEKFLAPHNVQIVCRTCNMTKNARTMQEFIDYCKMIAEKFS